MLKKSEKSPKSVHEHKIHFYRQIAFTFIGAGVVVLVGLIYFSLSQALIVIHPTLEDIQADFNVLVKTETINTTQGIDANLVYTEIELERTADAQLLEEGESQQAVGQVKIFNISKKAQPLVGTTRLMSEEGVLFRLKDSVTVPAEGDVDVAIYADKAGKEGEIGPTRFTIPGLNQARQQEVYAKSEAATTGGTKAVYQVTQEAIDKAMQQIKERLVQQAKTLLQNNGQDLSALLPNIQHVEIISEEVDPKVGTNAQIFTVNIKANVAFVVANEAELLELAQKQLYASTSIGYELSSSDQGSFTYNISNFDADNQTAQLRVVLKGQKRIGSTHPLLDVANYVGRKPEHVKNELEADPGVERVEIQLRPFWLRKIPRLVDHIYIQFVS